MARARPLIWHAFTRVVWTAVLVMGVGCAPIRVPQAPSSAEWSRPVLPALVQPTDPIIDGSDTAMPDAALANGAPDFDRAIAPEIDSQRFDLVSEGVAAGDVFSGLAEHAALSLAVHVPLTKPIWLKLSKRPLVELLDAVAAQCDCRYELVANRLDVFADGPYLRSYNVDYLDIEREFDSALSVDNQVENFNDAGAVTQGASSVTLHTRLSSQPWASLLQGLSLILNKPVDLLHNTVGVHTGAGLITVRATHAEHTDIRRYLTRIVSRLQRQVLIEASVIEISLDERHAAGVDWQQLANAGGVGWVQQLSEGVDDVGSAGRAVLQFTESTASHSITAAVRLLQQFGDVRVVSSPRIVALNNQPSILKVVDNAVYFSLDVERVVNDELGSEKQNVSTAIHTVPIGLVLQVTPQISERGEVLMNIRPSISRIVRFASDPNPALAAAGVRNDIPEVQTRELDTTLRVRSGHTVALGGLRQLTDGTYRDAVPGLGRLPVVGHLFRSRDAERRQVELLILLTPRVLPSDGAL